MIGGAPASAAASAADRCCCLYPHPHPHPHPLQGWRTCWSTWHSRAPPASAPPTSGAWGALGAAAACLRHCRTHPVAAVRVCCRPHMPSCPRPVLTWWRRREAPLLDALDDAFYSLRAAESGREASRLRQQFEAAQKQARAGAGCGQRGSGLLRLHRHLAPQAAACSACRQTMRAAKPCSAPWRRRRSSACPTHTARGCLRRAAWGSTQPPHTTPPSTTSRSQPTKPSL